jgi:hypothetical protein
MVRGIINCQIFKVGAVGETTAVGEVGVLRDTIDEYFPLGIVVHDIDVVVKIGTGFYTRASPSRRVSSTSRKKSDNIPVSLR